MIITPYEWLPIKPHAWLSITPIMPLFGHAAWLGVYPENLDFEPEIGES